MPRYVCDECGEVFESREGLRGHEHESSSSYSLPSVDLSVPSLTWKQMAVLGGVFLMATLFMGTVFFASSIGPSSPSSTPNNPANEPSPPVGYSIRSQADVPQVDQSDIPSPVSGSQLSQEVQLYLLLRPSVLLQYSCTDCPGTVDELRNIAQSYNSERNWVYVAPYRDMDSQIAATAFRQQPLRMEEVDRSRLESFICSSLSNRPIQCALQ